MEKGIYKILVGCSFILYMLISEALLSGIKVSCCLKSRPKKFWHINKKILIIRLVSIIYFIIGLVYWDNIVVCDSNLMVFARNIEIPLIIFLQLLEIPVDTMILISPQSIFIHGRLFKNSEKVSYKIGEQVKDFCIIEIYKKGQLYTKMACNQEMFLLINKYYKQKDIN